MALEEVLEWFLERYGLFGVFIVSFLGNTIPYSTIPYLILIVIYAGVLKDPLQHLVLTLLSGLGAALGKLIVYFFGYGIRRLLPSNTRENIVLFSRVFRKSTFIAVYLFAALPLPDDILYIPLGAVKYSVTRYFTALLLGKITITGATVFFGSSIAGFIRGLTGYPDYVVIPILLAITIYLMYLVVEIDWSKAAEIAMKKGFWSVLHYVLTESIKATVEIPSKVASAVRRKPA
ncbi:MAG: hypothetical protein DRO13_03515 [Thermoprotei archaeon]|nr:MAG: hypothetical protein DRO13_03515 [Thermoprotei archaeon]